MDRFRVLLLLPSFHAGGAENYALRLIRFAPAGDYEWHVMAPKTGPGDLRKEFENAGALTHRQTIGFFNPLNIWRFYQFLRAKKIQSVVSFNGVFGGVALATASIAGVSVRIGWHRRSTPAFKPTFSRRLYALLALKLLEAFSTRVLSNSEAALAFFHGQNWVDDSRFAIVPNGLDVKLYRDFPESKAQAKERLGLPKDATIVGHVGRYDPAKNHQTIFAVAQELLSHERECLFVFCGKDTDSPEFAAELARFGIADFSRCLGLQTNLPRVYRAMDVFYFPSVTEGQPNALIEAILSGTVFVASDIPGNRSVVPPWLHGCLVPALDVHLAVEAIRLCAMRSDCETNKASAWAAERFDLAVNMNRSLETLRIQCG